MKLSLLNEKCVAYDKGGYPVFIDGEAEFDKLSEVIETLQTWHIAISSFSDNYRKGTNWVSTDMLAVDFDDGVKAVDIHAQLMSLGLNHLIIASKNHLKDKNDGKGIVERYHVFIPFNRSVTTDKLLYAHIAQCFTADNKWKVDLAVTKDKCRYYFKHREMLYCYEDGSALDITPYEESRKRLVAIQNAPRKGLKLQYKRAGTGNLKHTRYWMKLTSGLRTEGQRHNTARKAFWFLIKNDICKPDAVNMVLEDMKVDNFAKTKDNLERLYDWVAEHH